MTSNTYRSEQARLLQPCTKLRAVTPSDSADLPDGQTRAIYVGTAGAISVIGADDGTTATLLKGATGWIDIAVKRIRATGTTATDIVAVY
jgi:hypothetical protein